MARYKLTLSVERGLTDRMKMQAVREHRDLSDIVEELFAQYLARRERAEGKERGTENSR